MAETIDKEVFDQNLTKQVERLERNRDRDKKKAKRVAVLSASGSAGATLLLGLSKFSGGLETLLQAGSLILGTATTIVLAWDKLFDHKRLWVISAQTVRELYGLREEMDHLTATGRVSDETLVQMFGKYKEILSEGDKKWDNLRSKS